MKSICLRTTNWKKRQSDGRNPGNAAKGGHKPQRKRQKGSKKMKRTQVFLPDPLIIKLEQMAAKKGISKGEIIRRALEEFFKKEAD